ncbi:hypothetical protein LJC63_12915 [Ruminococcaceae bacterium OttesenSCG-928-L11]|nr:hypothetical protein [Ruminococcaceae bacterium OttesenSCG-928-L11]
MKWIPIQIETGDSGDLCIAIDSAFTGSQYDDSARGLRFSRPDTLAADALIVCLSNGQESFAPLNLGQDNALPLTADLTALPLLRLQIALETDRGTREYSNILELRFRGSLLQVQDAGTPITGQLDALNREAFAGATQTGNTLSFTNRQGETVARVTLPAGQGGDDSDTPAPPVTVNDIPAVDGDIALTAGDIPFHWDMLSAQTVHGAIQSLFTSVSDGKTALAADIRSKGGFVPEDDGVPGFDALSDGIRSLQVELPPLIQSGVQVTLID